MDNQLEKALRLARKNNDRLIIYDSANPGNALAVIPLDEYEKKSHEPREIRDLTEQELLDKINRDIAIWKNEQNIVDSEDDEGFFKLLVSIIDRMWPDDSEPENLAVEEEKRPKPRWSIPDSRKKDAEEVIEEDTQYLEDII